MSSNGRPSQTTAGTAYDEVKRLNEVCGLTDAQVWQLVAEIDVFRSTFSKLLHEAGKPEASPQTRLEYHLGLGVAANMAEAMAWGIENSSKIIPPMPAVDALKALASILRKAAQPHSLVENVTDD